MVTFVVFITIFVVVCAAEKNKNCRDRSIHLRQDGGLCFEIAPWQLQPVELDMHLLRIRSKFRNASLATRSRRPSLAVYNSELYRYTDTVIAPFLDTYHQNIQNLYQQITSKTLKSIKEFITSAVSTKQKIHKELTERAEKLQVPAMCDEERRSIRTLASKHVAQIYYCTDEARASLARMGRYAEEMISLTQNHMQSTIDEVLMTMESEQTKKQADRTAKVSTNLADLSRAAIALGYELDLSLTNARRHNEQTCERLSSCKNRVNRATDAAVEKLRLELDYCVYA